VALLALAATAAFPKENLHGDSAASRGSPRKTLTTPSPRGSWKSSSSRRGPGLLKGFEGQRQVWILEGSPSGIPFSVAGGTGGKRSRKCPKGAVCEFTEKYLFQSVRSAKVSIRPKSVLEPIMFSRNELRAQIIEQQLLMRYSLSNLRSRRLQVRILPGIFIDADRVTLGTPK